MTTLLSMLLNPHLSISLAFSEAAPLFNSCYSSFTRFLPLHHKLMLCIWISRRHLTLWLKLWKFGICDSLWLWIRAYLSNRLQYVSVGQSVSSVPPVLSGVPQGSILGPLLFIVFVNNLPSSVLSSSIFLFADDAKCVMPVSSITDCQLLQNDLTRLVEWSTTWNLLLNEDKCSVFHLTASQFPLTYNYSISGRLLP